MYTLFQVSLCLNTPPPTRPVISNLYHIDFVIAGHITAVINT